MSASVPARPSAAARASAGETSVSPLAGRGRRYAGATAQERDAARRERLLAAGLEGFGTAGFRETSIERLCAEAGVSTRNFYDHFRNREALLIAVYDEVVEGAQQAIGAAIAELPPGSSLLDHARAGVDAFIGHMLGDPRRAQVNFVEVVGASLEVEAHRRTVLRQFALLITEVAQELMRHGSIAPIDPQILHVQVSVLIGGVQEALTDWLASPEPERPPLELVRGAIVDIIDAAIGPRP